jgi:hypothetical protein
MSDTISAVIKWVLSAVGSLGLTGFLALLLSGFAPTFILEVVIRFYPEGDRRRDELRADYAFLLKTTKGHESTIWVGRQLATALFDGLPVRISTFWRIASPKPRLSGRESPHSVRVEDVIPTEILRDVSDSDRDYLEQVFRNPEKFLPPR